MSTKKKRQDREGREPIQAWVKPVNRVKAKTRAMQEKLSLSDYIESLIVKDASLA